MNIALSMLPIATTAITFDDSVLPPGPCYFGVQLNPLYFIHPTEQQRFQSEGLAQGKGPPQSSSNVLLPPRHFVSYRIGKGHVSWAIPLWRIRLYLAYTLTWQFPSPLNFFFNTKSWAVRDLQLLFRRPSFDKYPNQPFKPTSHTSFFNCASFQIKSRISNQWAHISQLSLIQFLCSPSPLLHTLKIHSHAYSS